MRLRLGVTKGQPLVVCVARLHPQKGLPTLIEAAGLKGKDAWAAKILGARDAITERIGTTASSNSVRELRERVEQQARTRLGLLNWERAYETGRTASIDSLLSDIENAGI